MTWASGFFFFHWNIVDLQYCVSFRGIVKWSRYAHTRFPDSSVGKESICTAGDPSSIPGSGPSAEGIGYSLQYSGLENSMDCIVHGVTKSQTQLSDFHLPLKYTYTLFQIPSYYRLLGIRTFKSFQVTLICSKFWKPLWLTLYLLIPFEDLCHLPVHVFCFWEF